jgi:triphosphoribosyl-dephospho-CoA synthase
MIAANCGARLPNRSAQMGSLTPQLAWASAIGDHAAKALIAELTAYPKPGLVSLVDNGSHEDMTARHFVRSTAALRGYFTAMARAGANDAGFDALRRIGVEAEVAMRRATGGVNTHRGAIFSLGLLAAAAGAQPGAPLGKTVRARWGADIIAHRRDPASHGSAVTRVHGEGGAQAEAAAGFPSVYDIALPAYREVLRAGLDEHAASVQAFFALLARVDDTNLLHRGGVEGLRFAQRAAQAFLDDGGVLGDDPLQRAVAVHRSLVARRLSPGGCADLLAACLFVHRVESLKMGSGYISMGRAESASPIEM